MRLAFWKDHVGCNVANELEGQRVDRESYWEAVVIVRVGYWWWFAFR